MNGIGDNFPPDMAQTVGEVAKDLSNWMSENPVIADKEKAREAKILVDRAKLGIQDLEAERTKQVAPLNEQVKLINEHYRSPRELLKRVLDELERRVTAFLLIEESKRLRAAEEARRIAEEAEAKAREAERIEREAMANAASGELGIDVAQVTQEADTAFKEYEKAQRQAAIAERDTHARLGGGFMRAVGLKEKEIPEVTDAVAAVKEMGPTDTITKAILTSARAFKKCFNRWPNGITIKLETKI